MSDERKPIVIDVPATAPDESDVPDAESRAVGAHPEFQALLERGRKAFAAGRGIPAEQVFHRLGLDGKTSGPAADGIGGRQRLKGRRRSKPVGR